MRMLSRSKTPTSLMRCLTEVYVSLQDGMEHRTRTRCSNIEEDTSIWLSRSSVQLGDKDTDGVSIWDAGRARRDVWLKLLYGCGWA